MPGISERAERSVSLRRRLRWKLIAKRWASSRSCCRMNISALLLRIGMASLAWGRNTRSGFVAAPASRAPLLAGAGAGGPGTGGSAAGDSAGGGGASAAGAELSAARWGSPSSSPSWSPSSSPSWSPSSSPSWSPSWSATSRSLASATIGSPTPGRVSIPTSRAAASAIASCPLPPSTTMRSGSFQVPASWPPSRARGADLVGPVAALVGSAVDEHHHRGDGGEPLQVRDVVTLDDPRQALQLEAPLQLAERELHVSPRVAPGGEARGRVLVGQLDELLAVAPLRDQHLHLLVAPGQRRPPLVEPFGLQRRVFDLQRQQDLVGRRRAQVVVETDERGDELGVGELLVGEGERAAAVQLAVADRHHRDLERDPLPVVADDVLVDEVAGDHPLLLQRHLQRLDLIADLGGHLELRARRRVAHAPPQPVEQLVALAVEKEPHVAHLVTVGFARDRQHAGRRAAL